MVGALAVPRAQRRFATTQSRKPPRFTARQQHRSTKTVVIRLR